LHDVPALGISVPDMGTQEKVDERGVSTALADALFTSVQQRVLGLLFGQPERRFQSVELIRLVGSGTGATHRMIKRLAQSGLVRESVEGRQKYYQANPDSPVFEELVALVRKTVGLLGPLRTALGPLVGDEGAAFVYGSVAEGKDRADSDVDLMVIADELDYPTLFEALQPVERQLGRPINANLMTPAEWRRKRAWSEGFSARVDAGPRLFVLGSENELE
jgi:hypothetical protein